MNSIINNFYFGYKFSFVINCTRYNWFLLFYCKKRRNQNKKS